MAKILGLPFDDYVKGQIETRQNKLAKSQKDPEDLVVFNSNTSWVRLTSGVQIDAAKANILSIKLGVPSSQIQGNTLAKNLVLWGGVTSFSSISGSDVTLDQLKGGVGYGLNNAYGFLSGPEQGLKPFPGIESITCNYKNNGSLKQAQVKLKCFTRSQFEALEAIYLRLGYTLVLEWGNVNYFNNKGEFSQTTKYSIPNILFKSEGNVDPDTVQTQLNKNKKETYGNYDGMLAKVTNFSWQLNNDLSFDITLDLISVGDIIDSLKANIGGTSESGDLMTQVNVSGSIQNIVAIQINSNASRINAFLADLYEEVYKTALQSWQVSGETQQAVQQANEIVEDVKNSILENIKKQYIETLKEFRKYYDLFIEGLQLFKTEGGSDTERFKKIISDLGLNALTAKTMFEDEDTKEEAAERYNKCLNAIETAITNLKPGDSSELYYAIIDPSNGGAEKKENINSSKIKDAIKFALDTRSVPNNAIGNKGKYGRVEGTTYEDPGSFQPYIFSQVLQQKLGIDPD